MITEVMRSEESTILEYIVTRTIMEEGMEEESWIKTKSFPELMLSKWWSVLANESPINNNLDDDKPDGKQGLNMAI